MKLKYQAKINFKGFRFYFKTILSLSIFLIIIIPTIFLLVNVFKVANVVNDWIVHNWKQNDNPNDLILRLNTLYKNSEAYSLLKISFTIDQGIVVFHIKKQIWLWFVWNYLNYFTQMSNILIATWLMYSAFNPRKEGRQGFLGLNSTIICTSFITITMFIAIFFLGPMILVIDNTSKTSPNANNDVFTINYSKIFYSWLPTFWLHIVSPIAFNLYIFFYYPKHKVQAEKNYLKVNLMIGWLILFLYGVYSLVKGELFIHLKVNSDYQYPYFFFRIHEEVIQISGGWWLLFGGGLIFGIFIGWSILLEESFKKSYLKQNK